MSYLKIKIYVKSRFNVLLLVYALKWCVLVLISYEALDIASKLWMHLIMVDSRHPDTAGGAAASHQLCKSPTDTGLPNQTSIDQSIDWEDKSTNKSMIVS